MTIEQRRERALGWLETIYKDVQELVVHNHVFWEVQNIIKKNQRLADTPSVFYDCLALTFSQSATVTVRRHSKLNKQSVSLHRLLEELRQYPKIITRDYFVGLYGLDRLEQKRANRAFDKLAGKDAGHLDPGRVQDDIDELKKGTKPIEDFVDRRVAHYDPRPLKYGQPKFDQLTDAIHCLEKLTLRCSLVLKAESAATMLPTFQYDWKAIFKFPWIEPASNQNQDIYGAQTNQEN